MRPYVERSTAFRCVATGFCVIAVMIVNAVFSNPGEAAEQFSWQFFPPTGNTDRAILVFANTDTTEAAVYAACTAGGGTASIGFLHLRLDAAAGTSVQVEMAVRGISRTYTAQVVDAGDQSNKMVPWLVTSADDPIWLGLKKGRILTVGVDGRSAEISLKGSARPVSRFAKACAADR